MAAKEAAVAEAVVINTAVYECKLHICFRFIFWQSSVGLMIHAVVKKKKQ